MRRFLLVVAAIVFAGLPCVAQSEDDISIPEFRQSLFDFAAMVDVTRGTNYANQITNIPDSTLIKWYTGVPNGRAFKDAVAGLKARSANGGLPARRSRKFSPASFASAHLPSPSPVNSRFSLSSSLSPAGISSVTPPDLSLFSPAYASGIPWQLMVTTVQLVGLMPIGPTFDELKDVRCDSDTEALYSVILSVMHGVKDAGEAICEIVPNVLVVILGEGTEVPAKEVCFAINLIVNVFNSAAEYLVADCEEIDGLVNSAQIEAGYHNTVTLFNQKFRLKAEANLVSSTPMGIFELPSGMGGFLEYVRAITADTITKMTAAGYSLASANNIMLQGDALYNARNFKQAFKTYQQAYKLAVQ